MPCRKCKPCRMEWRRQWTGRLMAEYTTSKEVWFSTFTYGGGYDNPQAYNHDKRHLFAMFDQLRKHGYEFKPFGVGELGEEKGRAHWHIIFFWKTEPPKVEMFERIMWKMPVQKKGRYANQERHYWPYGYTRHEYPKSTEAAMAYILKYLDKGTDKKLFVYSNRPPIGQEYLLEFARNKAREGMALFPRGMPIYQVEGNCKNKGPTSGRPYDYWLDTQSAIFDRMIIAYCLEWAHERRNQTMPYCKFVTQWAKALDFEERNRLVPDPIITHMSVVERLTNRGHYSIKGKIAYMTVDWDPDIMLVVDVPSGSKELRWIDEDGEETWRSVVRGPVQEIVARKPEGITPARGKRLGHRWGQGQLIPPVLEKERQHKSLQDLPSSERKRLQRVIDMLERPEKER